MKQYLSYIVAAGALSCATTQSAKEDHQIKPAENYSVKPVVVKSTRDCSNLLPQELIDCITEEESPAYTPTPIAPVPDSPTTPTYTVTPKVIETVCDPKKLPPEEVLKCIMKEEERPLQ